MRVIDPGHVYELNALDGDAVQRLTFVKREGPMYPGNVGHHSGTTLQEVLRACINRLGYVGQQEPCMETTEATQLLVAAIALLEIRAARKHGRYCNVAPRVLLEGPTCPKCGHVGCPGHGDTA